VAEGAVFVDERPTAEVDEALAAGRTGPACPFCLSHETTAVTNGWPGTREDGEWTCGNCGESGLFDPHGLYWRAEGDPSA